MRDFDIPFIEIDGVTFGSSGSKNKLLEFLDETDGSKTGDLRFLQYDGYKLLKLCLELKEMSF